MSTVELLPLYVPVIWTVTVTIPDVVELPATSVVITRRS